MALECVCVGDRLGSTAEYAPGPSTYVKDGHIYAKSIGRRQISPGEGAEVRARLRVCCTSLRGSRVGSRRLTPLPLLPHHTNAEAVARGAAAAAA